MVKDFRKGYLLLGPLSDTAKITMNSYKERAVMMKLRNFLSNVTKASFVLFLFITMVSTQALC